MIADLAAILDAKEQGAVIVARRVTARTASGRSHLTRLVVA
jgi:hypothetical protein